MRIRAGWIDKSFHQKAHSKMQHEALCDEHAVVWRPPDHLRSAIQDVRWTITQLFPALTGQ